MNDSDMKSYRDRWKAVCEVEIAEQRQATVEERWVQLNALIRLAAALGLLPHPEDPQESIVWERWAQLKVRM